MGMIKFLDEPVFQHLWNNNVELFKAEIARKGKVVLEDANLRGVDFRAFPLENLYIKNCYLRDAVLKGCDIRHWDLEGSTIHDASISGTFFPEDVDTDELLMSLTRGTRIRARLNHRVVVGITKKKPGEGT